MRNRSAIWIFTILLFLACLYQLSFSWVTKSFESDIHDLAEMKYDSLSNEAVEFVINGDTLVIGPDKEKQQIVSFYEQKLLAETERLEAMLDPYLSPEQRRRVRYEPIRQFIRNRRADVEREINGDDMPLWNSTPEPPPITNKSNL